MISSKNGLQMYDNSLLMSRSRRHSISPPMVVRKRYIGIWTKKLKCNLQLGQPTDRIKVPPIKTISLRRWTFQTWQNTSQMDVPSGGDGGFGKSHDLCTVEYMYCNYEIIKDTSKILWVGVQMNCCLERGPRGGSVALNFENIWLSNVVQSYTSEVNCCACLTSNMLSCFPSFSFLHLSLLCFILEFFVGANAGRMCVFNPPPLWIHHRWYQWDLSPPSKWSCPCRQGQYSGIICMSKKTNFPLDR